MPAREKPDEAVVERARRVLAARKKLRWLVLIRGSQLGVNYLERDD
jgi:hypothetical protein